MSAINKRIADAVIDVLDGRGGFDGWWDSIDDETQDEIREAIGKAAFEVIETELSKYQIDIPQ